MGVGGAPRAVGRRVAGSPLREAEGIHPADGHYARSCAPADSEFIFGRPPVWLEEAERTAIDRPRTIPRGRCGFHFWMRGHSVRENLSSYGTPAYHHRGRL